MSNLLDDSTVHENTKARALGARASRGAESSAVDYSLRRGLAGRPKPTESEIIWLNLNVWSSAFTF